jgi:hypothetical protein
MTLPIKRMGRMYLSGRETASLVGGALQKIDEKRGDFFI